MQVLNGEILRQKNDPEAPRLNAKKRSAKIARPLVRSLARSATKKQSPHRFL
jgi:hypothetical protein